MQQVWIPYIGGPEVLEVREKEDPQPGPGEVRIKVHAAGINFADLMARMGVYPDAPPLPAVVGYEVSGVIDAIGPGESVGLIGKRVLAATKFGGYSSHLVVNSSNAVPIPDDMDMYTAAAIPVTGLTAWMMLEEQARVRKGDRVLIHSAGGGVGLMALDIAKWRGAYAIGTASASKHSMLKDLGYDQLIDYRNLDYEDVLKEQEPLDIILDPVGGESWAKGFRLLRTGGKLVCFGFSANAQGSTRSIVGTIKNVLSVPWMNFNPLKVINENKGVMGLNMGRMWDETERLTGFLRKIIGLWQEGVVRPRVHAALPFSKAGEAHQLIHDRKNLGKILLVPDEIYQTNQEGA